jgi:hypothetical protein
LLPALVACGWAPLYVEPKSGPASAALQAIKVEPIPDRIGQRLEIALRNTLNPSGEPVKPRYRLATTLYYSLSNLGLISAGTATLGRVDLTVTYQLIDLQGAAVLLTNTVHVQNSFALNPNQYSTVVAEYDAAGRGVVELNQEIVSRLTLFMQHRLAQPKPG